MTKDQITRLAKEAGIRDCTCDGDFGCIERFAALVAEREWVGLAPTDFDWLEQMFSNKVSNDFVFADIVCAIEAKLKEKNHG